MNKGFFLSTDGLLALLLILCIAAFFPAPPNETLIPVIVAQKQQDLLVAWQKTQTTNPQDMQRDIEQLFPNQGFELQIGNHTTEKKTVFFQPNTSTIRATLWVFPNQPILVLFSVHY